MKIGYCLLLCAVLAGCGPKSNEEKAHDLITENLKTTLPDFSSYTSLNFGALGTAFLPYDETSQYLSYQKSITVYSDSIALLQKMILADSTASIAKTYKERIQVLQDSTAAKSERNKIAKQGYTPEKLFKLTHAYNLSFKDGTEKKTEAEFFLDKDLTKVVKVHKLY